MNQQSNKQLLIPYGKMKGEIDGEFESFYLARDENGQMYRNRNPEYSENRYDKSKGWEAITYEEFEEYKRQLHFIAQKTKGLRP